MNTQQTRIWALIDVARNEHNADGRVSIETKLLLTSEGYELSALPNDIQNLNQ